MKHFSTRILIPVKTKIQDGFFKFPWLQVLVQGDIERSSEAFVWLMNEDIWQKGTNSKDPLISLFLYGIHADEEEPFFGKMQSGIGAIWDDYPQLRVFYKRTLYDDMKRIQVELALDIINRPRKVGIPEFFKRPPNKV